MKKYNLHLLFFIFVTTLTSMVVLQACSVQAESGGTSGATAHLTVYNNNLAYVREHRSSEVDQGVTELRFANVSQNLMPETVKLKSTSEVGKLHILEQNFEHDLIQPNTLLKKYLGKKIKVIQWNEFQDRREISEATLLSLNGPVYEIAGEIYIGKTGTQVLPSLPEDLVLEPTLSWLIENQGATKHDFELSYLTQGMSWKADYHLVLDEAQKNADLSAWVTLSNQTGTEFDKANLKLVAGDISRVTPTYARAPMMMKSMAMASEAMDMGGMQQGSLFEYHEYSLGRLVDIKNQEQKQINFIEALGLSINKEYRVDGGQGFYGAYRQTDNGKVPVQVFLSFENEENGVLGVPLPAGTIRVFVSAESSGQEFIGENTVSHIPVGEEVEIKVGNAFDVSAERKQTAYNRLTQKMHVSDWEITIKNHKNEDVSVNVFESLSGNWEVASSSHNYVKEDAFRIKFPLVVPKKGEVTINYQIKVGI